ncbi:hypothetical protein ACFFWC_29750 [Plantactinospora siamensis]|uniref:SMP domain-containing protein n=1 Tax=Plantactinospora siamensis TaxID=555372 RepID=A0ABV6NPB2_9ACTN
MADMRYDTDQLRQGGRISRQASDQAGTAGTIVTGTLVSARAFGDVGPAGALANVLEQAKADHAKGAQTAAGNTDVSGQRADTTANAGDDLTRTTTVAAQSGVSRQVADGMS